MNTHEFKVILTHGRCVQTELLFENFAQLLQFNDISFLL